MLGRDIDVDLNAGIFVTLNPAGKKYGGRSRLPDNLKALFRPVAMGRPDNELIAEVRVVSFYSGDGYCLSRDYCGRGQVPSTLCSSRRTVSYQIARLECR